MVGGAFLGFAVMVSAMATAQTGSGGGWFAGLFSTGSGGSTTGASSLIAQQDALVAAEINKSAKDCANGAAGTVGEAIKTAMTAHSEMASATPNVESLFDVNSNCFASISQIFDLSFAIPSLASILSAAQNAVMKYAQKKVCSAVSQVTGMVTTPLNQAIGQINQLQGFTNINGMAGAGINNMMASIDSNLGSSYHPPNTQTTYTVGTNAFNTSQTAFDSNGGVANLNNLYQQYSTLSNGLTNLNSLLPVYNQALSACGSENVACTHLNQQNINTVLSGIANAQTQLANLAQDIIFAGGVVPTVAPPKNKNEVVPDGVKSKQENKGWFQGITGFMN